jgi:transcriptional regulator of arginine metabolism
MDGRPVTDSRTRRLRALADLIRAEPHDSQEELTDRLRAQGFAATQATVSRDLVALGAVKVKREGVLRYVLPDQLGARDWAAGQLERIVREWVQAVEPAGQMLVVRTPPGSAHLVASAIDQAQLAEVAGTVAGDDTIFLAVRNGHPLPAFIARFETMMGRDQKAYA